MNTQSAPYQQHIGLEAISMQRQIKTASNRHVNKGAESMAVNSTTQTAAISEKRK